MDADGASVVVEKKEIKDFVDLFLAGVAIVAITVMLCMCYLHMRLRQEHFALAKDKATGGGIIRLVRGLTGHSDPKGNYRKVQTSEGGAGGSGLEGGRGLQGIEEGDEEDEEEGVEMMVGQGQQPHPTHMHTHSISNSSSSSSSRKLNADENDDELEKSDIE